MLTDITDLKKAEKSLRASEEKFSKAFQNAPLLMTITSLEDGTYLEVNEAFVQVTGFSRAAALGKTSTELGVVGGNQRRQLPNLLKQNGRVRDLEIQVTCADGSNRTCLFSGEKIQYEGKERLLSIALDITDRKQNETEREKLQAQLLQAQKMESIGRLAGGVAHDFNNNLAVIQGHTQLMLETSKDGDVPKENLVEILNAAKRSAGLTRQLLAFARKQTISPKILDLNETIEGMLKMLRRLIGENIELSWHPGANLFPIKMDPAQIDQVLANLCVNARDAIDGVGKLAIETRNVNLDEGYDSDYAEFVPGTYAMLTVSDDGSGMDEATLNQIFEPFFTTKALGQGTGLGLSTVYGIVNQNKGVIRVYSEPGKGTAFKIYIPAHENPLPKDEEGCGKEIEKSRGETVLLVEDDPSVLQLTQMLLKKLAYNVISTNSPEKAIALIHKNPGRIHLLITDVVMPQMSGHELAQKLKEIQPGMQTLFMSGYTSDIIASQGVLEKGVNFIEKPFSVVELGHKVREALEKVTP